MLELGALKIGDKVLVARPQIGGQYGGYVSNMGTYLNCPAIVELILGDGQGVKLTALNEAQVSVKDYNWDYRCLDILPNPHSAAQEEPSSQVRYKRLLKRGIRHHAQEQLKSCADDRRRSIMAYLNCILPEHAQRAIDESIMIALNSHIFDEWGITSHFEKGLGNSILLFGLPGVGKTMIAEGLAAVLDKPCMVLSNDTLQSNIPGQMERNIAEAFKQATETNAVLVIDECDSLLYDRNSVGAIMSAEINFMLSCIEQYKGIVILTTNRLQKLDSALERRILCKVEIPRPDVAARMQIWRALMPPLLPVKDLNYDALAQFDLSGGQIKNAILKAARAAVASGKKVVTQEMFASAALSEEVAHAAFNNYADVVIQ